MFFGAGSVRAIKPVEEDISWNSITSRTGFQGALNGYRTYFDPKLVAQLRLFAGRTIDVPSSFIGGKSDWAVYLTPGAVDVMKARICTQMRGFTLLDGAGH
jgi:hypothetical protein